MDHDGESRSLEPHQLRDSRIQGSLARAGAAPAWQDDGGASSSHKAPMATPDQDAWREHGQAAGIQWPMAAIAELLLIHGGRTADSQACSIWIAAAWTMRCNQCLSLLKLE